MMENFLFYHMQLKPFAEEILNALENGKIQIFCNGKYMIEEKLKLKLESDKIYKLKHS